MRDRLLIRRHCRQIFRRRWLMLWAIFSDELTDQISSAMGKVMGQISSSLQKSMGSAMTSMMDNMQNIFSIAPDAFAKAIQMNMSEEDLQELMTSLMTKGNSFL